MHLFKFRLIIAAATNIVPYLYRGVVIYQCGNVLEDIST